jgi:hypothetical protein
VEDDASVGNVQRQRIRYQAETEPVTGERRTQIRLYLLLVKIGALL